MRVSELIEKLQELREEYGDLPVTTDNVVNDTPVMGVGAYNENGCNKKDDGIDETHIHIF